MSRMPFGGLGLPGSNPRAPPREKQYSDSPGAPPYGSPDPYGANQGYRDRDPRIPPQSGGGYNPARSPGIPRQAGTGGSARGPARQVPLRVEKVPDKSLSDRLIFSNLCAVSPEDFPPPRDGSYLYILVRGGQPVGEYVVTAQAVPGYPQGCISLSDPQRSWCGITMRDTFTGELYDPFQSGGKAYLGSLDLVIGFASKIKRVDTPYDEEELSKIFIETYQNQVLTPGQRVLMNVRNIPLVIDVKTVGLVDLAMASDESNKQVSREGSARGILTSQTRVLFHRDSTGEFKMNPSMSKPNSNAILSPDFKFEDMGIGGLGNEFSTIFRRAFASRVFPPGLVAKIGIPHVKGILLYGPPGTGKTLIARQIGKMLNARPPKVINGPEVLNKFVGQSEENIRKLFADAEAEYKEKGEESSLHIIIFDELDAVCKQRGSGAGGGTGVGDSVVNQLLSKLDGVDQLNNILLIGMTNRKDMIDDALLRPGRLEVHLEISLPDEAGRLEIIKIHTSKMRTNGLLNADVNLEELAAVTKNFSGAEINGLVKAAASFAFSRHTEVGQLAAVKQDVGNMKIGHSDFANALTEVRPAYGVSEAELEEAVRLGIIPYSTHINGTIEEMMRVVGMIKDDPNKFSTSVLFHGPKSSGKTALAAHIAMQSGFPFVKLITPADLVGYRDDFAKKDYVHKAFADAYKSPASILILDDFERLIGWNPIGMRCSETMLQALTTLIVSKPPKNHRLLVFVTTSRVSMLKMLEIDMDFAKKVAVPPVSNSNELRTVLRESRVFDPEDIEEAVNMVQQGAGSDKIGVGIKTVLDCIFEARAGGGPSSEIIRTFSELLVEKIQEMQG
ncbi:P-loop containing nucleoside triphosphate hydrolase protein [Xylaria bambusicola]|uniref:P-loop containing nucleoside triphosphate hydrolase protein n=1 Tax=Xylaria bambusicola TaxID=326684 RepID=UPI0020074CEB|nr:P-loop containing nucleoside triphosphate hydrolase protein [Xylaria bambusicola]KAI0508293.1 P-loop containing nucleoside triphosphate hydrolase protein [Xylaria bambusicola]